MICNQTDYREQENELTETIRESDESQTGSLQDNLTNQYSHKFSKYKTISESDNSGYHQYIS